MRLCACDFDGTLLRGGRISERDLEAVNRWRQQGNLFAIATGRGYYTLSLALSSNPDFSCDYLVCNNGALVLDGRGCPLWEGCLSSEVLKTVFASTAFAEAQACALFRGKQMFLLEGKECGHWRRVAAGLPGMSLAQAREDPLLQISLGWKSRDESFFGGRVLARDLGGLARVELSLSLADIVPPESGKVGGVEHLLSLLGLPREQVIAIGDDGNDLGMLESFEGYALSDSPSFVLEAAGRKAESVGRVLSLYCP